MIITEVTKQLHFKVMAWMVNQAILKGYLLCHNLQESTPFFDL